MLMILSLLLSAIHAATINIGLDGNYHVPPVSKGTEEVVHDLNPDMHVRCRLRTYAIEVPTKKVKWYQDQPFTYKQIKACHCELLVRYRFSNGFERCDPLVRGYPYNWQQFHTKPEIAKFKESYDKARTYGGIMLDEAGKCLVRVKPGGFLTKASCATVYPQSTLESYGGDVGYYYVTPATAEGLDGSLGPGLYGHFHDPGRGFTPSPEKSPPDISVFTKSK